MNSAPSEEDLQRLFRTQELQGREVRRRVLLNEAALTREQLDPEDQVAHDKAIADLRRTAEEFKKLTRPDDYWTRLCWATKELWKALIGDRT